jgi:AcrR family transcriptional regulator
MAARAEQASSRNSNDNASALRRQRIIAAANDLLDEGGLDGLTIRAVLERSGLARRAFYESFVGKDDLVVAVFDETLAQAAAHFTEEIAQLPDPLSRIRHVVAGLVVGAVESDGIGIRRVSAIVREHMRLAEARPTELEKALRPLIGVIAGQISEGIRAGQLRDGDPVLQATLIYNLLATTIHPDLLSGESGRLAVNHRQRLLDEIWEFCRRAIVA